MHQTAQKNLLSIFEDLSKSCKLIYTTHSHHLINPKWLNGTYIIQNESLDYENELSFVINNTSIIATPYRQFV
jgi:predicted ATP-dependent endonuclease of OLD family